MPGRNKNKKVAQVRLNDFDHLVWVHYAKLSGQPLSGLLWNFMVAEMDQHPEMKRVAELHAMAELKAKEQATIPSVTKQPRKKK